MKIVSDAGGLNPAGLAEKLRELADRLGIDAKIAHIEGDDLMDRLAELQRDGLALPTSTRAGRCPSSTSSRSPPTRTSGPGASSRRSTAAPTSWSARASPTRCSRSPRPRGGTAGSATTGTGWPSAVVAGHVIECGPQATGGNYPFYDELGDMRAPGFPIAEIAEDGSTVITKHESHGGAVTVGTVTAQLLYEIAGPRYPNPDVVARFDTISPRAGGHGPRADRRRARRAVAAGHEGLHQLLAAATATR